MILGKIQENSGMSDVRRPITGSWGWGVFAADSPMRADFYRGMMHFLA
jgi:hypothetical protein